MKLPDFLTEVPYGDIRLAGHRISLYHVVHYYRDEGYSAEKLHEEFPTLPLPLIHQVIAFYRENQAEVDTYLKAYEAEVAKLEATLPKIDWEELKRRRPDVAARLELEDQMRFIP